MDTPWEWHDDKNLRRTTPQKLPILVGELKPYKPHIKISNPLLCNWILTHDLLNIFSGTSIKYSCHAFKKIDKAKLEVQSSQTIIY